MAHNPYPDLPPDVILAYRLNTNNAALIDLCRSVIFSLARGKGRTVDLVVI